MNNSHTEACRSMQASRIARLALAFLGLLGIASCDPYGFYMGEEHFATCRVLTSLHSVDQGQYVATIRDSGAIGMSRYGITQYKIRMDSKLVSGDGMRLMLRPVVEQRAVKDSGIVLTISTTGVRVDSGGKTMYSSAKAHMDRGTVYPLVLMSENTYTSVILGCDTLFRGRVGQIESDDIVVQALPKSEVLVINPNWGVYEEDHETK